MPNSTPVHKEQYAWLITQFADEPDVSGSLTEPVIRQNFGATALKVDGKIFAMLSSKEELVVKLPAKRVDELISAGVGKRFDPGHGRLMKEWLVVLSENTEELLRLSHEALDFVRGH